MLHVSVHNHRQTLKYIYVYLCFILGEDTFGFRRAKGNRDAIGMIRIIAERTLEIDEELCICFIDWQKAFDCVKWTKLRQILKITGIDWGGRKLISNLYMDQRVKVRLEEELDKDAVCHQFCSTCTANALPRKLWMGLETSTSEGKLFKL